MTEPDAVAATIALARQASERGWTPATSGNFSARIDLRRAAVTASGGDKGALTPKDVLVVDVHEPLPANASAEAPVHCALYRKDPSIGAVVHTHSVAVTVLSRRYEKQGALRLEGLELLKALRGLDTHDVAVDLPVYANTQDMVGFGKMLESDPRLSPGRSWGLLLAGHGLYAWGRDPKDAWRHAEALNFLIDVRLHEEAFRP